MRMTINLQSVDGRRDMKTTVDIDESRLQISLGEVISLSLDKVEREIRTSLGLAPKETKKETPTPEDPAVDITVDKKAAPAAEVKSPVVAQPPQPVEPKPETPPPAPPAEAPAEKPAEAPPAAEAAPETPKTGDN